MQFWWADFVQFLLIDCGFTKFDPCNPSHQTYLCGLRLYGKICKPASCRIQRISTSILAKIGRKFELDHDATKSRFALVGRS